MLEGLLLVGRAVSDSSTDDCDRDIVVDWLYVLIVTNDVCLLTILFGRKFEKEVSFFFADGWIGYCGLVRLDRLDQWIQIQWG